ncbi:MAG: FAD-dependent thymidylate synthase [Planctomycetaceae bacterium]|jgi:thymidylate synthase (FAD)|nr:FAD-dependent thymidylate synthase [Planctomycetaceae bacterium]
MKNIDQISELRWQKIPVLDNGFVCLVDVMGDDSAIVQAARVSYGDGTKKTSDDRTLLRYLLRHQHTTPFEMAELKLLVRVPMDCWRQWIRHRTASVNEYSTRYSIAIDAASETNPTEWRMQSTSNRQGSCGNFEEEVGKKLTEEEHEFHAQARNLYDNRIARGVAREQARKDLPLSTYTEAYWKIDLHNLFRFLSLRMESSAQFEIMQYATAIGEKIVQPLFPYCWEAFLDYQFGAIRLSRLDQGVITRLAQTGNIPATRDQFLAAQDQSWQNLERCREREECYEKLQRMNIVIPKPVRR